MKKAAQSADFAKAGSGLQAVPWLQYMPKETQAYVEKNMREFEAGQGQAQRPTFQEIDDQLRSDPRLAGNPNRYKVARDEAARRFEEQTKAIKQRDEEAVILAQEALVSNGGNFSALPANVRAGIPRGQYDDMLTYASKIAAGQPVSTDWDTYTQLRAMSANDPAKFSVTDLRLHYPRLAPAQREQLLNLQMKARDPKQQPNIASLSQQLSTAHDLLGLSPHDREKKGKFDDAVSQAIAAEVRQTKRELTFDERDKIIKRMMLPTQTSSWLSTDRMYQVAGTSKADTTLPKIGDEDRKLILAALKAEGVQPTESAIAARFNLRYGIR